MERPNVDLTLLNSHTIYELIREHKLTHDEFEIWLQSQNDDLIEFLDEIAHNA